MTWWGRIVLTVCLGLALVSVALAASDAPVVSEPAGLRAYVEGVLKDLVASELKLTLFQDAVVDTVEKHDTPAGIPRYTCWLKNAKGKTGYVAVVETKAGFRVLALSATPVDPEPLLTQLDVSSLDKMPASVGAAKPITFVEKIPLVGTEAFPVSTAATPVGPNQFACAMAMFCIYKQTEERIPMFAEGLAGEAYGFGSLRDAFLAFHGADSLRPPPGFTVEQSDGLWYAIQGKRLDDLAAANLEKRGLKPPAPGQRRKPEYEREHLLARVDLERQLLASAPTLGHVFATMASEDDFAMRIFRSNPKEGIRPPGSRLAMWLDSWSGGGVLTPKASVDAFQEYLSLRFIVSTVSLTKASDQQVEPMQILQSGGQVLVVCGTARCEESPWLATAWPGSVKVRRITEAQEIDERGWKHDTNPIMRGGEDRTIICQEWPSQWPSALAHGVHLLPSVSVSRWMVLSVGPMKSKGQPSRNHPGQQVKEGVPSEKP